MFIYQGQKSFYIWHKVNPEVDEELINLLENKFDILKKAHESLKDRLNKIYEEKKKEKIKEMQFSEKIDELNQETDMLLDEFNKWET